MIPGIDGRDSDLLSPSMTNIGYIKSSAESWDSATKRLIQGLRRRRRRRVLGKELGGVDAVFTGT